LDVVNWEKLKTGRTPCWKKDTSWNLPDGAIVVLDEAHKQCSGPESKSGELMARLKGYPVKVILVSATMAASPLQMRHSGYLLDLHKWNNASWHKWIRDNGCWYDSDDHYWRTLKGSKAVAKMAEINKSISDRLLYLKLAEIPGFPETVIRCKLYDLDKRDTEEINDSYADMSERMKTKGASKLAEVNKARERTEMLKTGLLAELTADSVADGNSVVVFLNYREPLFRLKSLLNDAGVGNISTIYGGQDTGDSTKNRDRDIAMFQDNTNHVCLAMSQAGSVAVSLHDVRKERPRISYITPSYSAPDVRQCLGRISRMGGTPTVQTFVLAAGTAEERVYRSITAKLKNIDALNDGDLEV
jgi:hypothetical protein